MNITFISEDEFHYTFDSDNGIIKVGKHSAENTTGAQNLEDAANIALHCFDNVEE